MTVRGGGVPVRCMASNAVPQNGSAASELAADAYPCIMVWVFGPAAYKDVARVFVHLPAAPLDVVIPITASVPSCSEPSRPSLSVAARWAAQP